MQQTFDLSNGFNLSFEGNTHHQTSDILMFERRAFSVQGGYWQSDAAVNLSHDDKRWSWTVGVFVNNIENNRVLTSSYWDSFSGITTGNPGPPRTYGARLSVRF
jgi:iron complex outermembrane receptor protein